MQTTHTNQVFRKEQHFESLFGPKVCPPFSAIPHSFYHGYQKLCLLQNVTIYAGKKRPNACENVIV